MDNFDRNESTLAGTGYTHDTILVLFQNVPSKPPEVNKISERAIQSRTTVRLRSKVKCQQHNRIGAIKERGEIPTGYKVSEIPSYCNIVSSTIAATEVPNGASRDVTFTDVDTSTSTTKSINSDYFLWIINCLLR